MNEFKIKNGLIVSGSAEITNNLTVNGRLTAEEYHVSFVSSSVLYESGSTKFGDSSDDTHEFTGSLNITGSILLNGTTVGTGKLDETTFESFTASYLEVSSSLDERVGDLESFSSSLDNTFVSETEFGSHTSSINGRVYDLETESGSIRGDFNSFTSSYTNVSTSIDSRLDTLETLSGSFTGSFSGSFTGDGTNIFNIPASGVTGLNLTQIADGSVTASVSNTNGLRVNSKTEITGSLIVTNGITGSLDYSDITNKPTLVSGSEQINITGTTGYSTFSSSISSSIGGLSSSVATTNLSQDGRLSSLETASGSIRSDFNTYTGSNNTTNTTQNSRLTSIETSTGSLNTFTSSASGRLSSLETASGSIRTDFNSYTSSNNSTNTTQDGRLSSLETASGSIRTDFNTYTGSNNNRITSIETSTASLNTFTSSTNTFISNVNSGLEFTGSNVTVKGNLLVKGTNTTVNSTTLDIGDNIIQLNGTGATNAGLVVRDSTSPNTLSGSLLWDTANDRWIAGALGSEDRIVLATEFTNLSSSILSRATSLETASGSIRTDFNSYTSSNNSTNTTQNSRLTSIETSTGSLNSYTSSNNTVIGTLQTATSSLNTFTSSASGRLTSLETASGSIRTDFNTYTSSNNTTNTTQNSRLTSIETSTGSLNTYTSSNNTTNTTQNSRLTSIEGVTGSIGLLNTYTGSNNTIIGTLQTTTGSLNTFTSSASTRLSSLETESGSIRTDFNTYTSSNDGTNTTQNGRLSAIETSTGSLNSYTSSNNTRLGIIETATGSLNTFTSSASGRLSSLESASSSIRSDFNTFTSSNNTVESTQNGRLSSLETYTGSNNTVIGTLQTSTGSLNTFTSSAGGRLTSLESASSSIRSNFNSYTSSNDSTNTTQNGRLSSLETASSSIRSNFNTFTSSVNGTNSTQDGRLTSIESKTGSIASLNTYTGSNNTIIGTLQTSTSSLNTFTSSINGAVEVTGSNLTVKGNLLVKGTSTQVDSTTVSIGDNIIQLNGTGATNAGLVVRDATAPGTVSGSLLWDTLNDKWIAGTLGSEDDVVLRTASQTLTNKTISGASNTLTNIANASLTNSSITIGSTSTSLGSTSTSLAGLTSVTSTAFTGSLQGNISGNSTNITAFTINQNVGSGSQPTFAALYMAGPVIMNNSTSPNSNYLQFGDNTGWIYRFVTNVSGTPTTRFSFKDNGDFTSVGLIAGSNFSGTSSGTNTGDETLARINALAITTVGTITGGTWNGTTIAIANGGTGATTAAAARTNLGATTVGGNLFTLTNPSAISFPRINADNTVTALNAADFRSAIGAGTSSTVGTVTSVGGTGTVSGLSLSGTVTASGSLTLGGTLTLTSGNVTTALGFTPYNATNPSGYITGITFANVSSKPTTLSGYGITDSIKSNGTINNNIDSDWGESFTTFDPIPSGTPPLQSPNIRTVNIGANYSRRTQLAFDYASDLAYFRRRNDAGWQTWREFIHSGNIGSQTVATAGSLTSMNISQFTNNSGYATLSGANSFSNSYNEFGDGVGSVSNDGSWNGRLNVAGSQHARIDVVSVSDGIITTMFSHIGQNTGRVGTYSNHSLSLMVNGSTRVSIDTSGHLLPNSNNTHNLGSTSLGWANIYTNDLHLSNMNKPEGNDIDGTSGTWTIQEGAENLYIINNRNNKKFKISLEEIL